MSHVRSTEMKYLVYYIELKSRLIYEVQSVNRRVDGKRRNLRTTKKLRDQNSE
jgi:hypothetical protein